MLPSRQFEKAYRTNIVSIALGGDVHPDHAMVARFVTAHVWRCEECFGMCSDSGSGRSDRSRAVRFGRMQNRLHAAKKHPGTHAESRKNAGKLEQRLAAMLDEHCAHDNGDSQDDRDPCEPPRGTA